ncbi:hypothetical protein SBOR_3584 [Sclerotinia borealis F-4128]|uniref:Uncharacterized protein n=1 Tax=Sclerotinia borealis (strain F-4128) TaxID=1432307 RepID=W9CJG8_SCLBF|nr:hypothetical protein SBOR_3584 [Sclerotinia borealis F-4128]
MTLGIQLSGAEDDFLAAVTDSLKSFQAKGLILTGLSMGGNVRNLSRNVVFESGDIVKLARNYVRFEKVNI